MKTWEQIKAQLPEVFTTVTPSVTYYLEKVRKERPMMLKHQRYDVRVQRMNGYRIEVYWRADQDGVGPCLSLYIGHKEELRFDLFDGSAHMHVARQARQPRIFYPQGATRAEYAQLAMKDMVQRYPQTQRCAGWAAEMLGKVAGPAAPTAPGKPSPGRGRFRPRSAPRRLPRVT